MGAPWGAHTSMLPTPTIIGAIKATRYLCALCGVKLPFGGLDCCDFWPTARSSRELGITDITARQRVGAWDRASTGVAGVVEASGPRGGGRGAVFSKYCQVGGQTQT